MESDSIYFARRAGKERIAAMKAPHPSARRSHLDMAARYDELSGAIAKRNRQLGIDVVTVAAS